MENPRQDEPESTIWPPTDWSGLGRAARSLDTSTDYLNDLILKYQVPLKVYLVASFPSLRHQVDEIVQDFTQDRLLRDGWLAKADRERGRFRQFLKTSLKNFVHDRLRSQAAQPISVEDLQVDPASENDADKAFDLNWARTILAEVLARMERDCREPGKQQPQRSRIWEVFQYRVLLPTMEDAEPLGYEELVARTGLGSPTEAHNLLATAKRIFTRHLTDVISEYEQEGEASRLEIEEIKLFLQIATIRISK